MREIVESIGEPFIGCLVLFGALLSALSTFGLIRMPDVYVRSHAVTKSSTLGVLSVLLAGFLYFILVDGHTSAKLILGIIFVFITTPVGGHLICRAAYRSGVPLWEKSVKEELREALDQAKKRQKQEQSE